jgi:curved DNA-binding protein
VNQESFIDYYETLQLSPNADRGTIERVFRLLAKRYHPDNLETGDTNKFSVLVEAHQILTDPERRASYDAFYEKAQEKRWHLFAEASEHAGIDSDRRIHHGILSLLYMARRQNASKPGVGILHLEQMLECPREHMEFHIWYLKEKGCIERTETGGYSITARGVDAYMETDEWLRRNRKDLLLPTTT